jgi:transcription elongation factor GreA
MADTYLTREGLQKLQDEFKALQKQKHQLLDEVNKAAAMGDLRENAEYHAAREHLQHVSSRLADLDAKLQQVQIIDDLPIAEGEARIGMKVTLQDVQTKEEFAYVLTGPDEADPAKGKLSIASPLGKSMLGKKKGESFTLKLPKAIMPYKIVGIERPS